MTFSREDKWNYLLSVNTIKLFFKVWLEYNTLEEYIITYNFCSKVYKLCCYTRIKIFIKPNKHFNRNFIFQRLF